MFKLTASRVVGVIASLLLLAVAASTLGCVLPPQPITEFEETASPPPGLLQPAGIDEQIFRSDIIVVASFVSAVAGVQTIPGGIGIRPTYRPMQVLTFRAEEYLQGSGPTTFSVEVLDTRSSIYNEGDNYEGFLSSGDAMAEARQLIASRNTTWDDRPGVLFLKGPLSSEASSTDTSEGDSETARDSASQNYGFALFNTLSDPTFSYSVDTNARAWLPGSAVPTEGTRGESGSTGSEFITDGATNPPPAKTLAELKTRIAEIAVERAAGDGSEAYESCLYRKFTRERHYRDWTGPLTQSESLNSGLAQGTTLYQSSDLYYDNYLVRTTSGLDASLFEVIHIDEDAIASNGHFYALVTTRPLPGGEYTVNFHSQLHEYVICNHNPTDTNYSTYNVTVEAPLYTLHEAFFDPVAVGTGVGADGANGVLKPVGFVVGSMATEMRGLEWENDRVVLTISPYVSLGGQVLEFIELDGSVSLSLVVDDAVVDEGVGAYSWLLESQPWEEGDLLMLRIREGP